MHHFFVSPGQVLGDGVRIVGPDASHMKNVLRMKPGGQVLISDGTGKDYTCGIISIDGETAGTGIWSVGSEGRELSSRIWLFRGLSKSDKMDLIIQKAVELGTFRIVPVAIKNTVIKLDPKEEAAKVGRWQTIAGSAAKQSKRSVIPAVMGVMSLTEAFEHIRQERFEMRLIPYE